MARLKKTVLRTIRIDEDLDKVLGADSEAKSVSFNTLVTQILIKYAEWDRFVEKVGMVSIMPEEFRVFIGSINEEILDDNRKKLGPEYLMDFLTLRFGEASVDSYRKMGALFAKYAGVGQIETKIEGRNYTSTLRHNFGKNWSRYLQRSFMTVEKFLGIPPSEMRATEYALIITGQLTNS